MHRELAPSCEPSRPANCWRSARRPQNCSRTRTCQSAMAYSRSATSFISSRPARPARAHVPVEHEEESFVLANMDKILAALTRGLDLNILTRGHGEEGRGVTVSYQCQSPVLGAVLPNNSPGVHTLWLPAIPLQVGLLLKPGSQEPWTPYRMAAAFMAAGIPGEAIAMYPGGHDVGQTLLTRCQRSMIFAARPDCRTVRWKSSSSGTRAGLFEDSLWRRCRRSMGRLSGFDG